MHCVYVPERASDGEVIGLVAVITDASARKRAEQDIERARDEALAASRAKDDFIARLSHELRTPLSPILLLSSEAARNPALPEAVRVEFDIISKNAALEARLIDDLLDFTRIMHGKLPLERRVLDVHSIIKDAVRTVHADIEGKRLSLNLALQADPAAVNGDAVRLQQVFWNLIQNAVKFTPEGGRIAVGTCSNPSAGQLAITISDTGAGLTSDEMARIFNAFSQGDHGRAGGSHRFGGLGLGLAISRMLVELHSGTIRAESDGRNRGSHFIVELPLSLAPAGEGPPASGEAGLPEHGELVMAHSSGKRARVLLVEDHEPTRTALAQLLRRRRYAVFVAETIAEARLLADREPIDLLISDIGLPDGSGCELMAELRARHGLSGIALSGYGSEQDLAQSRDAGFVAHLTKPVRVQTLDGALEAAAACRASSTVS